MSTNLNIEKEKDREKEKVGDRPANFNLKKSYRELECEISSNFFLEEQTWNSAKFGIGEEKMKNPSGHQDENERQWKKSEEELINRYDIPSIERVAKKFLEVLCCSHAKQRQINVQNKPVARAKLFFC